MPETFIDWLSTWCLHFSKQGMVGAVLFLIMQICHLVFTFLVPFDKACDSSLVQYEVSLLDGQIMKMLEGCFRLKQTFQKVMNG